MLAQLLLAELCFPSFSFAGMFRLLQCSSGVCQWCFLKHFSTPVSLAWSLIHQGQEARLIRRRGRQSDNRAVLVLDLNSGPGPYLCGKRPHPLDRTRTERGWVIACCHDEHCSTLHGETEVSAGLVLLCPECNRNSPFVVLHIFC